MNRRVMAVGSLATVVVLLILAVVTAGDGGQQITKKPTHEKKKPKAKTDADWKPHPGPVPFLMYHVIGEPQPGAPFPELYVSVADFEAQVDWLDRQGYEAVTQATIEDGWEKGAPVPPKPIVLTFDDGYLGQYTDAFPILRRHGWVGTLNLKAEGSDLSDRQVQKMIDAGWELASHTIGHLDLTTLDPATLKHELADSRTQLRRRFDVPVDSFCYPAGRYDDTVVAAVRAAGYESATTTDPGLADKSDPFSLKRIRISRDMGLSGFITTLRAQESQPRS
jgi:peptidoglycan/xylan/chitin deacetylase (PgdA/CDA1 family)